MDTRSYSKQFIMEFIELYRNNPSLWKVKSRDYTDRNMKAASYEVLVQKLKEVEPDANRDFVVRKINNIRSSFRKEVRKVQMSKASGAGADDIYKPRLWYYDLLTFLVDQGALRNSKRGVDLGEDDYLEEIEIKKDEESADETVLRTEPMSPAASLSEDSWSCFNPQVTASSTCLPQRQHKRRKQDDAHLLISEVAQRLQNVKEDDEFDVVGKNVAMKLRNIPKSQRIFAEKLINDVLFEAELGTLNRNWNICITETQVVDNLSNANCTY